jgi:hypothetical protein
VDWGNRKVKDASAAARLNAVAGRPRFGDMKRDGALAARR